MKIQLPSKRELFERAFLAAAMAVAVTAPAHAGGLDNVKSAGENLLSELKVIIPIFATLIGLGVFAAYSAKFVEKDTAIRWGIGIAFCGGVGSLVAMLYGNAA